MLEMLLQLTLLFATLWTIALIILFVYLRDFFNTQASQLAEIMDHEAIYSNGLADWDSTTDWRDS